MWTFTITLKTFYRSGVQKTTTHLQLLKVTEKTIFWTSFRSCRFFVVHMTQCYKMFYVFVSFLSTGLQEKKTCCLQIFKVKQFCAEPELCQTGTREVSSVSELYFQNYWLHNINCFSEISNILTTHNPC